MSVSEEVPRQWHKYFEKAQLESFRDLATAADVSPSTAIACLRPGSRMPKPPTVEKVAAALGISADKLRELRGDPRAEPFKAPKDADYLDASERRAVTEVVRALTHGRKRELDLWNRGADLSYAILSQVNDSKDALAGLGGWAKRNNVSGDDGREFQSLLFKCFDANSNIVAELVKYAGHLSESNTNSINFVERLERVIDALGAPGETSEAKASADDPESAAIIANRLKAMEEDGGLNNPDDPLKQRG